MSAPIRCEARWCDSLPRYVTGGGAAAAFYYCEAHARDLCACEAWWFSPGCKDNPGVMLGDGGDHKRERCAVPWLDSSRAVAVVTRPSGTPGGSLMHSEGGGNR